MISELYVIAFVVTGVMSGDDGSGTLNDAKQLHIDMLTNYSKYVRPVNIQSDTLYVRVTLAVIAIQEFDEVLERFSVAGALFINWFDQTMSWDEKDYGGIGSLFVGYKEVWVPEIILTNPSEKLDSFGKEWQLIRYNSNGWASWTPGNLIKATCSIDVRYFPFDIQECKMEMFVWGYLTNEVKLVADSEEINTDLLTEHGSWALIGTSAKTDDVSYISKITFTFRLKRKPQYVIVNVVLPILFLCLLNVLVFVLPAESGERVSYAITVLLSIAVFMTIVSDTLPKTSEPLPIIGYFLMINLILSSLISLCTILNLRTYHKKDVPIPRWLTLLYSFLSCRCKSASVGTGEENKNANSISNSNSKMNVSNKNAFVQHDEAKKEGELNTLMKDSLNRDKPIPTWQDISKMFDSILLIGFLALTIISFCTFLLTTLCQPK